ncbi:hypothetical protein N0V88_005200 [Collariella sp. IMI 366227]|nr:hypothetical protein N0V88_005200 [Collariella sp. IMI 366227]
MCGSFQFLSEVARNPSAPILRASSSFAWRLREQYAHVADAAQADDANLLSGATAVADERRVSGETSAEHGGGNSAVKAVGDGEDPKRSQQLALKKGATAMAYQCSCVRTCDE